MEELRKISADAGCGDCWSDVDMLLDCLESVLKNSNDDRKPHALAALGIAYLVPGADLLRISNLLNRYKTQDGREWTDTITEYDDLSHTEDPRWREALKELADGAPRRLIDNYLDNLVTVFGNRLRQCDEGEKRAFYDEYAGFFRDVLAVFKSSGVSPEHDVTLTRWLAESDLIELARLMTEVARGAEPDVWERLYQLSLDLRNAGQFSAPVKEAIVCAENYFRWRERFARSVRSVKEFSPLVNRFYPWSSFSDLSGSEIHLTVSELEAVRDGAMKYGARHEREEFDTVLSALPSRLLEVFVEEDSVTVGSVKILSLLEAAKVEWMASVCPWPDPEEWVAFEQDCKKKVRRWVEDRIREYRGSFRDIGELEQEVAQDAKILQAKPYQASIVEEFTGHVETLARHQQVVDRWWQNGPVEVLSNGEMIRIEQELKSLEEQWGTSEGYKKILQKLRGVRDQLQLLENGQKLYKQENYAGAVSSLSSCKLPAAATLRTTAEQSMRDQRYKELLLSGGHGQIKDSDLEGVSADVLALRSRLQRGREFLDQLRREGLAIEWSANFAPSIRQALELAKRCLPSDAQLTSDQQGEFAQTQKIFLDTLENRAERYIEGLAADVRFFPLPDPDRLVKQETDLRDVLDALAQASEESVALARVCKRIETFLLVFGVQRAAIEGRWEDASQLLDSEQASNQLGVIQLGELKIAVAVHRLAESQSTDADWLELYRTAPKVLFKESAFKHRYLDLLRGCADEGHGAHQALLQRYFPEEAAAAVLVAAFDDPSVLRDLVHPPRLDDKPLVQRLLKKLTETCQYYGALKGFWSVLTEDMRGLVWEREESPVQLIKQRIIKKHSEVDAQLLDPKIPVSKIKEELDRHAREGVVLSEAQKKIDRASKIERRIAELDRLDPWNQDMRADLAGWQLELDPFSPEIREKRGWRWAIGARLRGVDAWSELDGAWQGFAPKYSKHSTSFYSRPESWDWFKEILKKWIDEIDLAISRLDWSLPRAAESARWQNLLGEWSRTREGVIWLERGETRPTNLNELRDCYVRIADQVEEFSQLHQRLLKVQDDGSLKTLRDTIPLSKPVEEIKLALMNPDVCVAVGRPYKRYSDKQKKT